MNWIKQSDIDYIATKDGKTLYLRGLQAWADPVSWWLNGIEFDGNNPKTFDTLEEAKAEAKRLYGVED